MESSVVISDRVRENTSETLNRIIDHESFECVRNLAGAKPEAIARHIEILEREPDVERYLQTNASLLVMGGVLLGATVSRKFLALPIAVCGFLLQHAVQGWCPPLPVFRRMGVRTRQEINREKYALKAVRGDFDTLSPEQREDEREPVATR